MASARSSPAPHRRRSATIATRVSSSLAGSFNRLSKAPQRGRGADEQIVREPAIAQDVVINPIAIVTIHAQPGQILQPQVAIAVDLRRAGPLRQVACPA